MSREVYFARREDGLIKIGCSLYPAARLTQLKRETKQHHVLLCTLIGGYALENHLHRHLGDACVEREWFRATPRVEALIASIIDGTFAEPVGPARPHGPRSRATLESCRKRRAEGGRIGPIYRIPRPAVSA